MGADIRLHGEVQIDGKWYFVDGERYTAGRNYYLFAFLADVRNDGSVDPLGAPRGLPKDASHTVRALHAEHDYLHGASWFTLHELFCADWGVVIDTDPNRHPVDLTLRLVCETFLCDLIALYRRMVQEYPNATARGMRIVFWFD